MNILARSSVSTCVASLFAILGCVHGPADVPVARHDATAAAPEPPNLRGVEKLIHDAERLEPLVASDQVKQFLKHASSLPKIAHRKLFVRPDKSKYFTEAHVVASPDLRATLLPYVVDEDKYYNTNFGSPLSYSRPLDILFSHGLRLPPGSNVLDFGYGYVGHLRLLASMGHRVTGVDVWPLLPVLYSFPGDQGPVVGPHGKRGELRLIDGRFPADAVTTAAVGNGYALIMSKNVLKRGYIHPERPVEDPKKLIHLGASDEVVLNAFYNALEPGGWFLIYNICPAPTPLDKPFVPWSDGRSPFDRTQFEKAGFEVIEFDKDDTRAVRVMGRALGWDLPQDGEPGMDLDHDLSVLYTLVRKPMTQR